MDVNLTGEELEKRLGEKKWQIAQSKGLASWANNYLKEVDLKIEKLPEDLADGIVLANLLSLLSTEHKLPKYNKKIASRIQKMENCSIMINHIKSTLGVRLIGIGAEDIVDGNMGLTLGLLWSVFRSLGLRDLLSKGSGGTPRKETAGSPEADLLNWFKEMTSEYDVEVKDFRTSFNDGMAWAALIDQFDPDYVDFDSLSPSNATENLALVFDIAEKKLGIPRLFEPTDLTEGTPDPKSVTLYCSLFYHAWTTNGDKIALANERRGLRSNMSSLRAELESLKEEHASVKADVDRYEELKAELAELKSKQEETNEKLAAARESRKSQKTELLEQLDSEHQVIVEEQHVAAQHNADIIAEQMRAWQNLQQGFGRQEPAGLLRLLMGQAAGGDGAQRLAVESDLDYLIAGLREHVGNLHSQWAAMEGAEEDEEERARISEARDALKGEMSKHVNDTADMSSPEQLEHFSAALDANHNTLTHVLKVRDAVNELRKLVEKKGYLMAHEDGKRWKKRWFVLREFTLFYYNKKDDMYGEEAGLLDLENSTVMAKDVSDGKLKWTIKIISTVSSDGEKKKEVLTVATKTKEERDDWLFVLSNRVLYSRYLKHVWRQNWRPDLRIIGLFERRNIGAVYLDDVKLRQFTLKVLEKLLSTHPETERFSLQNAGLTDEDMANVSNILRKKTVKVVNLRGNAITSEGISTLIKGLAPQTTLGELNLAKNAISDKGVEELCPVIEKSTDLHTLVLTGNEIEGECLGTLCEKVLQLEQIGKLQLARNKINDDGVAKIAPLLGADSRLEIVKLQHNQIGDEGVKVLCEALKKNTTIKSINLSYNRIGSDGLLAIQDMLKENTTLETIQLSGNSNTIGGSAVSGFSEMPVEFSSFSFRKV